MVENSRAFLEWKWKSNLENRNIKEWNGKVLSEIYQSQNI